MVLRKARPRPILNRQEGTWRTGIPQAKQVAGSLHRTTIRWVWLDEFNLVSKAPKKTWKGKPHPSKFAQQGRYIRQLDSRDDKKEHANADTIEIFIATTRSNFKLVHLRMSARLVGSNQCIEEKSWPSASYFPQAWWTTSHSKNFGVVLGNWNEMKSDLDMGAGETIGDKKTKCTHGARFFFGSNPTHMKAWNTCMKHDGRSYNCKKVEN